MIYDFRQYVCTNCGSHFSYTKCEQERYGYSNTEELVCVTCGVRYPVIYGIPRFVPVENYTASFGYQWNIHKRTQLDSYTGLPLSSQRLFAVTQWSNQLKGQKILEAGSGSGRFTEILLQTGAEIFSFDYSNAVEANFHNNREKQNLHLFQGDIYNIPLEKSSFDKVICLGVLQHTPDPEKAFICLSNYVRPGGELVIDVYRADIVAYLQWKYILRPFTKRLNKEFLYKIISTITPHLMPLAAFLRKVAGRVGARLVPVFDYSPLNLPHDINKEWSVLDTFDMYSPVHDNPQSLLTVKRWFLDAGFPDALVQRGPNGIVGRGKKHGISGTWS